MIFWELQKCTFLHVIIIRHIIISIIVSWGYKEVFLTKTYLGICNLLVPRSVAFK